MFEGGRSVIIPLDVFTLSCSLSQGIGTLVLGVTAVAAHPLEVNFVLGQ